MDIYNVWADKAGDIDDQKWIDNMSAFMQQLIDEGKMERFRIMRTHNTKTFHLTFIN